MIKTNTVKNVVLDTNTTKKIGKILTEFTGIDNIAKAIITPCRADITYNVMPIQLVEPQIIYAGTEENVEFFQQIADAFGIDKDSYSIELCDGEWEIIVQ